MMLGVWVCVVLLASNTSGSLRSAVIGGHDAKVGRWPWMVYVQLAIGKEPHMCGGSLLNDQWVLTAAHCGKPRPDMPDANLAISNVRVGVLKLKTRTGKAFRIQRFVVHDDYGYVENGVPVNDIALMQLQGKVSLNSLMSTVTLPEPLDDFSANTNPECWVTGWGYISDTSPLSGEQTLQELKVPLVDDSICRSMYPQSTDDMLCAGYLEGGKDACKGDSGGPLVCKSSTGFVQVGVVSFGAGCAKVGKTGVYMRVQKYLSFIKDTMAKYSSP